MKRPKNDILTLQGDWDTKIEKESSNEREGTCGEHCNTATNGGGLRLLEFESTSDLLLTNTFGQHKTSRLEEQCEEIDTNLTKNNTKWAY